jgi:hypothetical protein
MATLRDLLPRLGPIDLETAVLPLCEGGNPLDPTRVYPFGLPAQPSRGASVEIPVSQQVAADEADRFTIPLTGGDTSGTEVELLHVAVGVLHDAHPTPLSAGMAVVALPGPPAEPFFTIDAPGVPVAGCYAENQATMRHFLALEGARDAALDDGLPGE